MSILHRLVARIGARTCLLPCLYMGLITFLSHLEGKGDRGGVLLFGMLIRIYYGNLLHIPLYFGLGVLWMVALERAALSAGKRAWLAWTLTATFGIIDELHQSFVPGRDCSATDVLFDAVGGALAVWSWRFLRPLCFPPLKPAIPDIPVETHEEH